MKRLLFILLFPVLVFGQSKNQNYSKTRVYNAPSTIGVQSWDTIVNVNYHDGLGRPMQSIAYKAGGLGQDIITPITYDDYSGRQSIQYLPYAKPQTGGNTLNYRDNATLITTQKAYYKSLYPTDLAAAVPVTYSKVVNEASPLNRVLELAAPGDAWAEGSGHTIKTEYNTNISTTDKVYDFRVSFINNDTQQPQIYLTSGYSASGYYPSYSLYKTTVKDENWIASDGNNKTTVEYSDKMGRLVLSRKYNDALPHDTYYVYDDYGNLTFVISPQAFLETGFITTFFGGDLNTNFIIKQSVINSLCYTYKYDSRNRIVEKLTAGKVVASYSDNAEYIVYDNLDRPVFTQDGNQKLSNKWLFTKYDKFDRVVYTGECTIINNMDRTTLQNNVNSATIISENKTSATTFTSNGGAVYYTKDAYSTLISSFELFTINYYDNYTFTKTGITIPTVTDYAEPVTTALKALPTGTMRRNLGTTTWITTAICYDVKGRIIWSKTSQPHYNTYTTFQSKLNFMGQPQETKQNHIRSTFGSDQNIEVIDQYSYDFGNRPTRHLQKIKNSANNPAYYQIISSKTYNERGQLIKKGVGGLYDSSNPQQIIDYKYNIRGWLTQINDVNSLGTDLFAEKINYNLPTTGTGLYNGNISQISWITANGSQPQLKNYNYTYDALNRIKTGIFNNSNDPAQDNNFNLNSVTYDRNGNITFLHRSGTSGQTDLDKMTYIYNGNQLQRISEAGIATLSTPGFTTSIPSTDITAQYIYDKNGNLVTDTNKKIVSTTYNYLNLPLRVTFSHGKYLEYMYSADGTKIKKTHYNGSAATTTVTEYNNGFVYEKVGSAASALQYIPTEEGYAYKNSGGIFNYASQIKDHLGNVRISFSETDGDRFSISVNEIIGTTDYYPFGMEHGNNTMMSGGNATAQKIKYSGKEYQDELDLNVYDFGARNYDPAIGRWFNIDPKAESYSEVSPYIYGLNNPVFFIDPNGKEIKNGDEYANKFYQKLAMDELHMISVLESKYGLDLEGYDDENTYRRYLKLKKNQSLHQKLADSHGSQIAETNRRIIEFEKGANNLFTEMNSIKDASGKVIDIYMHVDNGFLPGVFGFTAYRYNESKDSSGERLITIGDYGIYGKSVSITVAITPTNDGTLDVAPSTLRVTKHEMGHAWYVITHSKGYVEYLEKVNMTQSDTNGGHYPKSNPSGQAADEWEGK